MLALPILLALGCRLADAHVESAIARKAASLNADEYCQFRHYEAMSDLDGDGKDDLVVLFNAEPRGGNDHLGFMAVFLSSDPVDGEPLTAATGGRGERDAVSITVTGRRIELGTLEYKPSDPMCCPSGTGTLVFELKDHSLVPVKPKRGAKRR